MSNKFEKLSNLFTRHKMSIRWSADDEEAVTTFAKTIEPDMLNSKLVEINGFEYSLSYIDILLFGKEIDDDMEDICNLVIEKFKSYGCPKGSCLILHLGVGRNRKDIIKYKVN